MQSPEHNFVKRAQIPSPLLEQHSEEQLNVEFLYVNGKPYLHTKSTNIQFVSIQPCRGRGRKEIEKGMDSEYDPDEDKNWNTSDDESGDHNSDNDNDDSDNDERFVDNQDDDDDKIASSNDNNS